MELKEFFSGCSALFLSKKDRKTKLEYIDFNLQILIEKVIDTMIGQAHFKKLDLSFLITNDKIYVLSLKNITIYL